MTAHQANPGKILKNACLTWQQGRQTVEDGPWSLADCLSRVDEGSAGGPAIPAGAGGNAARTAQRVRLKESYALVAKHELDVDHRSHMAQNHFQNGPDAWDYNIASACKIRARK